MKPSEMLKEMRARIAKGWVQGKYAVDANGVAMVGSDQRAEAWCLVGAMQGINPVVGNDVLACLHTRNTALDYITQQTQDSSWSAWNDEPGRTQEEVLTMLDKAIAVAEGDGK